MTKNLYENEIYEIYGIGNPSSDQKKKDVVALIDDEEEKTILVVTNHRDYLVDKFLNIIHKDYKHIVSDNDNFNYELVDSYKLLPVKEKYDEVYLMGFLSSLEFSEYAETIKYYVENHLNQNGTIYIQDLCVDNIFQYFFSPNQFNDNKVTEDTISMGLSVIYGSGLYKRRSLIIPSSIAKILNELNIKEVLMQPRNTMVIIKGTKT
jgi:hypothetical protein